MQSESNFVADKVIGIIIMIFSACGAIGGIMVAVGMGMLGAAISSEAARQGGEGAGQAAAAAGMFGMTGAVLGLVLIVMTAVSFIIGLGVFKSARWGFLFGTIWYGIWAVLNLVSINILGLLIGGAFLVYCILRLTGNVGPKPA